MTRRTNCEGLGGKSINRLRYLSTTRTQQGKVLRNLPPPLLTLSYNNTRKLGNRASFPSPLTHLFTQGTFVNEESTSLLRQPIPKLQIYPYPDMVAILARALGIRSGQLPNLPQ